jgi:excisionase family DNA binding protein
MDAGIVRGHLVRQRRDELLTLKEFADLVRVHHRTLRKRIRAGALPGAIRVGGQWRIDIAIALTPAAGAQPSA